MAQKAARFSVGTILCSIVSACLVLLLIACGGGATGHNPQAQSWQYTALGDSLAAGALAQEGYVPRYATYLNTDTGANITTTNLGVPGWHSSDLLNAIRTNSALRSSISTAQVITFDIGGNDLASVHDEYVKGACGGADNQDCVRAAITGFEQNFSAIIAEMLKLRSPSNTIIRTMDIYNPYVASDMKAGIFTTLEPYLDEANKYIHTTASANNIPVANVHQAFNGADGTQDAGTAGLLAVDGFHPNDAGHKIIADQLRVLGYAPLH